MNYLVDTDWVVDYLNGRPEAVALIDRIAPEGIAISIITFTEIYEGVYTGRDPQAAETIFRTFLQGVTILGINRTVAKRHAQIRKHLRQQKRPITHRAFDLLIAATTLTYGLMLVTRNIHDNDDVPEIKLYQPS